MNNEEKQVFAMVGRDDAGYDSDRKMLTKLKRGFLYPVSNILVSQSSSCAYLFDTAKDGSIIGTFNTVNLDFFTVEGDKIVPFDFFKDPRYNPYLGLHKRHKGGN